MEVTVGCPEVIGVQEFVCDDLEQLEGMKDGKQKLLFVRVEATYLAVKEALQQAGYAVTKYPTFAD
ncbi:hypothetical protein ABBQ32_005960 [Trebouxia sp. C0010 RCD-2024]